MLYENKRASFGCRLFVCASHSNKTSSVCLCGVLVMDVTCVTKSWVCDLYNDCSGSVAQDRGGWFGWRLYCRKNSPAITSPVDTIPPRSQGAGMRRATRAPP